MSSLLSINQTLNRNAEGGLLGLILIFPFSHNSAHHNYDVVQGNGVLEQGKAGIHVHVI